MNTNPCASKRKVARVAIDVRLYFDVSIDSEEPAAIQRAAREELERVADEELIRVLDLRFPNLYRLDDWPTVKPDDFQICQICRPDEANKHTRFPL